MASVATVNQLNQSSPRNLQLDRPAARALEAPQASAAPSESTASIIGREAQLIRRVLEGDHQAFYELIKPYERMIYASAISMLGNEADAEETAQEALLKAFRNLSRFRGDAKFSTWLTQITLNEGRMRIRKYRPDAHHSIDEPVDGKDGDYIPRDFADWREIPSESLERKELRNALKAALAALPEKYREIVILRDVQNLSTREAAEALGIGEANVKTRLLRGRLMLREALAPGLTGKWASAE